jgi:hypothetical protein
VTVKTVFADKKGMVYLLCPYCGDESMKPVETFPLHQPVNTACSCGKTYKFQVETRKKFRKQVALNGFYVKQDSAGDKEEMTITNLSLLGCRLLVSNKHTLHLDDSIKVIFSLDNAKHTVIKRNAIVRWIMGNIIGCRFTTVAYDPELGFYAEDFRVPK